MGGIICLQIGHSILISIQCCRQVSWNRWLHGVIKVDADEGISEPMHTTQSVTDPT